MSDSTYEAPPIGSFVVADSLDNLRCNVLWRSAVRVSPPHSLHTLLRQTEIGDLDVPIGVQKHILWLKIAIDDTVLVEAAHGLNELRSVEAGTPLAELLVFAQVVEKLSSIEEVHHEVELCGCLESVVQLDDEWTVDLLKDVTLGLCFDEKVALGNDIFAKLFQGKIVIRASSLY